MEVFGFEQFTMITSECRHNKDDLSHITSILQCAGVTPCFVGVKALQNFGARRISDVHVAHELTDDFDLKISRISTFAFQAQNWMMPRARVLFGYTEIFVTTKPHSNQCDFTRH
jgi:hypothetical protein